MAYITIPLLQTSVDYTRNRRKHFYCYSCLHGFKTKQGEETRAQCTLLHQHQNQCKALKPQRISYPTIDEDDVLSFTNIHTQLKTPFVCYAEFECALKPTTASNVKTGIASPLDLTLPKKAQREARKEVKHQQHEAASYAYKVVQIDPNFEAHLKMYAGVDAPSHFLYVSMKNEDNIFKEYIKKPREMLFSSVNKQEFDNATECHICNEAFKDGEKKVRDHCHIMGTLRGAAHNRCSLNYKINARR